MGTQTLTLNKHIGVLVLILFSTTIRSFGNEAPEFRLSDYIFSSDPRSAAGAMIEHALTSEVNIDRKYASDADLVPPSIWVPSGWIRVTASDTAFVHGLRDFGESETEYTVIIQTEHRLNVRQFAGIMELGIQLLPGFGIGGALFGRGKPSQLVRLYELPYIRWVGEFTPKHKAEWVIPLTDKVMTVSSFYPIKPAFLDDLNRLGVKVIRARDRRGPWKYKYEVEADTLLVNKICELFWVKNVFWEGPATPN